MGDLERLLSESRLELLEAEAKEAKAKEALVKAPPKKKKK